MTLVWWKCHPLGEPGAGWPVMRRMNDSLLERIMSNHSLLALSLVFAVAEPGRPLGRRHGLDGLGHGICA